MEWELSYVAHPAERTDTTEDVKMNTGPIAGGRR